MQPDGQSPQPIVSMIWKPPSARAAASHHRDAPMMSGDSLIVPAKRGSLAMTKAAASSGVATCTAIGVGRGVGGGAAPAPQAARLVATNPRISAAKATGPSRMAFMGSLTPGARPRFHRRLLNNGASRRSVLPQYLRGFGPNLE